MHNVVATGRLKKATRVNKFGLFFRISQHNDLYSGFNATRVTRPFRASNNGLFCLEMLRL